MEKAGKKKFDRTGSNLLESRRKRLGMAFSEGGKNVFSEIILSYETVKTTRDSGLKNAPRIPKTQKSAKK